MAYFFSRFCIFTKISNRTPTHLGPVALHASLPCRKSIPERPYGLLPFSGQKLFQERYHLIPGQVINSIKTLHQEKYTPLTRSPPNALPWRVQCAAGGSVSATF
jgi:hypothetical protein